MKSTIPLAALALALPFACSAADPPAGGELVLEDDFERAELGKGWTVQTGSWKIEDGVLAGAEIPADNHSAAARRVIETGDAVYQLRFQVGENTRGLHFGFDPKRGSLDKGGHLFSVIIGPTGWRLLKHLDKNRPEEDPNEVLATAAHEFRPGTWYTLSVTTRGTSVVAEIEGLEPLSGSHPSFSVPKPTLVFRALGDGVRIDGIRVWSTRS